MGVIDRTFRLTNEPGGLGLSCTHSGLTLAGVPLLLKSEDGFALRSPDEIEALVGAAYGAEAITPELLRGFDAVTRALNRGDVALAMTAAVMTRLPELDWDGAARLATAEQRLRKNYNPFEPRDWHGCWTDDDGADASGRDNLPENPIDFGPGTSGSSLDSQSTSSATQDNPNDEDEEPDNRPPLERKYDDLGPVAFAKQVTLFGDQLSRQGGELTPEEKASARAEYDFLQSRLTWWLGYNNKPYDVEANLLSASLTLFEGGKLSRITSIKEYPQSMVPVAMGAMVLDDSQAFRYEASPPVALWKVSTSRTKANLSLTNWEAMSTMPKSRSTGTAESRDKEIPGNCMFSKNIQMLRSWRPVPKPSIISIRYLTTQSAAKH